MEKTALVLSGGGSRGAYEVGVWRALGELDERFEIVTGTSVGSINGAVIAQGSLEIAERLWSELETSRIFDVTLDETLPLKQKWLAAVKKFSHAAAFEGGAGTEALGKLLRSYLDEEKIRSSPIDFGVVTVQIPAMKPCYIWKDEMPPGKLADYLIASSSIYPAIRPHEINGMKYIDGGYADNMPIRMALDRGATRIIAVNMHAIGVVRREKGFADIDIREIHSYWNLGSILLFDPNSARHNMRIGYLDAMRSYGVYDGFAYAFVKGALSATVKKYYLDFYSVIDLLGFHSVKHKIFDSVAYRAVQSRIFRRGIKASALRGFALDGMETAAEIFALDEQKLYSLPLFQTRLRDAVQAFALPETLERIDIWQDKGVKSLTAALELADRRSRTKFLSRVIRSCITQKRSLNLLPLAAIMTDEFSAALYLALLSL